MNLNTNKCYQVRSPNGSLFECHLNTGLNFVRYSEHHLNTGHLTTGQAKVCYSDVSVTQMLVIQIPTVYSFNYWQFRCRSWSYSNIGFALLVNSVVKTALRYLEAVVVVQWDLNNKHLNKRTIEILMAVWSIYKFVCLTVTCTYNKLEFYIYIFLLPISITMVYTKRVSI